MSFKKENSCNLKSMFLPMGLSFKHKSPGSSDKSLKVKPWSLSASSSKANKLKNNFINAFQCLMSMSCLKPVWAEIIYDIKWRGACGAGTCVSLSQTVWQNCLSCIEPVVIVHVTGMIHCKIITDMILANT